MVLKSMVSVIVSVYNLEGYLSRCLDSIVSQTYKELEIILVDDGSTDSSGSICDEYAGRDIRIKVIHQINKGIQEARNSGLKVAKGDYIIMPDGDDALHPQMIEVLYNLIISGDYDFSMCYGEPIYDVDVLSKKMLSSAKRTKAEELSRDSCMKELYIGNRFVEYQYHCVWNKLYKRKLIENIFFANTAAEDVEFNNRVYLRMNKAVSTNEPLYFWIQRNGSVSHQGYSLWYVNVLNSYLLCLNEIPHHTPIYRSYCLRRLYRLMLSKRHWTVGTKVHEIAVNNCKHIHKQTSIEFFKNNYIPFVEKNILLLFYYFPSLYSLFIKVVNIRHNIL